MVVTFVSFGCCSSRMPLLKKWLSFLCHDWRNLCLFYVSLGDVPFRSHCWRSGCHFRVSLDDDPLRRDCCRDNWLSLSCQFGRHSPSKGLLNKWLSFSCQFGRCSPPKSLLINGCHFRVSLDGALLGSHCSTKGCLFPVSSLILHSKRTVEWMVVNFMSVWMMPRSEGTIDSEMVVIFVSVWTVLPSVGTIEYIVVIFVSVWTVLPSEATVE